MKHALLGIAVSFCAACGSMAKAGPTTPAVIVPAGNVVFELGEVTMFDGADVVFKVHADGSTEMGYRHGKNIKIEPGVPWSSKSLPMVLRPGPRMAADGTFTHRGVAKVRASLDGTFVTNDGKTVPGVTVANDTIRLEHGGTVVTLTLGADGTLGQAGGNQMTDGPMRIVGADTPGKRRAILSLVALTLAPHQMKADGAAAEHATTPPIEEVKDINP
jgi:hypothetical protein